MAWPTGVARLTDLPRPRRAEYLAGLDALAEAVEREPERPRRYPVWLCPAEWWSDPATALGPRQDSLRAAIAARLAQLAGETRQGASTAEMR